jgi:hypothetical protein
MMEAEVTKQTLARNGNLRIVALNELVLVEHVKNPAFCAPYQIACEMEELEDGVGVYRMKPEEVKWLTSFAVNQLIQEWLR